MRAVHAVPATLLLIACPALGQTESTPADWSFSATAMAYFVPEDRNFVLAIFKANRDWLHLEGRYNYESVGAGSVWLGGNFAGGEKLAWEVSPMLGGVFGDVTGVAPGYELTLSWWKLGLYSEGEYVFDTGESSESFFYNWSELTIAPLEWFRTGLVTQRTRAYESDREIQRGLLVGFTYKMVDLAAYVFNPDDDPIVIVALAVQF